MLDLELLYVRQVPGLAMGEDWALLSLLLHLAQGFLSVQYSAQGQGQLKVELQFFVELPLAEVQARKHQSEGLGPFP